MSTTILHMSMSLDGLATGPDDDLELLHEWSYPRTGTVSDASMTVIQELFSASAVVMGWRTFDLGQQANGWYDRPPFKVPMFVPAHTVPERAATAAGNLRFVTDGIVSAVKQAQAEAGDDGMVAIVGGATTFQEAFNAGLVDELHLTLVPVVLGEGIPLLGRISALPLELEVKRVIQAPTVIHTIYTVRNK
jgi:dihydrofolate reductase